MNRNRIKAHALAAFGDMLAAGAALAAFYAAYGLLAWINNVLATITGVFFGFAAFRILRPIITDGFRPAINRLTAPGDPENADKTKTTA